MSADEIREIIRQELAAFFTGQLVAHPKPLSIAQQAINLAKQGKHEESKALLKAHSKLQRRRAA